MSLEEDDIVAAEPAPRASSAPPPPPSVRPSAPPPPRSEIRALKAKAPSSSSVRVAPASVAEPRHAGPARLTTPTPISLPPPPPVVASQPASVPAPPSSHARPIAAEPPVVAPAPPPAAVEPLRPSSLLDPTDVLFDAIYDLQFAETSWQAASFAASALASALRARAVVIHSHDLVRRELRTIAAHGSGAGDLLGDAADSEDDFVASTVLSNAKPLTMRFEGELPRLAPQRLSTIGAERSLVAVPGLSWGRCLALIEIVDADERLLARAPDAAAYVAERLVEYLARAAA